MAMKVKLNLASAPILSADIVGAENVEKYVLVSLGSETYRMRIADLSLGSPTSPISGDAVIGPNGATSVNTAITGLDSTYAAHIARLELTNADLVARVAAIEALL